MPKTEKFKPQDLIPLEMENDSKSAREALNKLYYVGNYVDAQTGPEVSSIKDAFNHLLETTTLNLDRIDQLYRQVRNQEKKVPGLYLPSHTFPHASGLPTLILEGRVSDALRVSTSYGRATVYLDGVTIVSYFETIPDHIGKRIDLIEEDLHGHLFFNTNFFTRFDIQKSPESHSDMRNVSKAFFLVNDRPHVALVQYLHPEGSSGEHYHSSEEWIIQLAGESYLESRPIDNDTLRGIAQLHPGDIHHIPPAHQHRLYTLEEGSITIPIKPLTGKQDHHYQDKSAQRIGQELDALLQEHYESGHGLQEELEAYAQSLTATERMRFEALVRSERTGANGRYHTILQSLLL